MRIKCEISQDEMRRLGFTRAMSLKWRLEDFLYSLVKSSPICKELIDEIQKKQKN